ncbi:MAG: glycogen debranching N-terminal domain-containing protein, partial [Dehalococcoidales bacterium]
MSIESIAITAGPIFALSDPDGNINPRSLEGLFAYDTRFLSSFVLTIDGKKPLHLGSRIFDHSIASFYASSRGSQRQAAGAVSIVRDRYIAEGLHEDLNLINHSSVTRKLRLKLAFDADFADIFEVRMGPIRKVGSIAHEAMADSGLCFAYDRRDFHRETWITFSETPVIRNKTAVFEVTLIPRGTWKTCITILPVIESSPQPMKCVMEILGTPFGTYQPAGVPPLVEMKGKTEKTVLNDIPELGTEHRGLREAYHKAVSDLRALSMEHENGQFILAAGLPLFMAIFGRDAIISAIQTKLLGPQLMLGTLQTLTGFQAEKIDNFRDAQPGKIPHEARKGELSMLEIVPHSLYYGSVDATPLFLILLWEAYQWTGDLELLRQFLPAAEAALQWIDKYGDLDGDGFVEYHRRSPKGLKNQGWRDSSDAISFADGTLAESPLALVEVQGYVYKAKRKMAEIYRLLGKPRKAYRLAEEARILQERFNEAFWMEDKGYYAMSLDRNKVPVDSIASTPGHCLWTEIISPERAPGVVKRLMGEEMFSGWGIRTLSSKMARYNPVSYHNGSIWPHDNSIIAAGFARYGFIEQAREVAFSIIDASSAFPNHSLPELFAGYSRRLYSFPVAHPEANAPQAWASGAIIYLLETLLGVTPTGDRLML